MAELNYSGKTTYRAPRAFRLQAPLDGRGECLGDGSGDESFCNTNGRSAAGEFGCWGDGSWAGIGTDGSQCAGAGNSANNTCSNWGNSATIVCGQGNAAG
jgi:hypothetical protein